MFKSEVSLEVHKVTLVVCVIIFVNINSSQLLCLCLFLLCEFLVNMDFSFPSNTSLSFIGTNGVECLNITILDDVIVEMNETFSVFLNSSNDAVDIAQNSATVTIIDDDTVSIGWNSSSYVFEEDSHSASVCAIIIDGEIARAVTVLFKTVNDTARGI